MYFKFQKPCQSNPNLQGGGWWPETWVGLTCISMFHHLACPADSAKFSSAVAKLAGSGMTKKEATQPRFRPPAPPCKGMFQIWYHYHFPSPRHPLFPVLALAFEKCEMATQSIQSPSSEILSQDIRSFVQKQIDAKKQIVSENAEVNELVNDHVYVTSRHKYTACIVSKLVSPKAFKV